MLGLEVCFGTSSSQTVPPKLSSMVAVLDLQGSRPDSQAPGQGTWPPSASPGSKAEDEVDYYCSVWDHSLKAHPLLQACREVSHKPAVPSAMGLPVHLTQDVAYTAASWLVSSKCES